MTDFKASRWQASAMACEGSVCHPKEERKTTQSLLPLKYLFTCLTQLQKSERHSRQHGRCCMPQEWHQHSYGVQRMMMVQDVHPALCYDVERYNKLRTVLLRRQSITASAYTVQVHTDVPRLIRHR